MKPREEATNRHPLVIIGGGNMGAALAQGMLRAGHSESAVSICETSAQRRAELATMFPKLSVVADIPSCREAVIAVKPPDACSAAKSAVSAGAERLISIAAGVRLSALRESCGGSVRIIRAMPNTPATVGRAATAISPSPECTSADRQWATELLSSVGSVFEIPEAMMDAFTGLVGSGPAYLFYVAEALRDAAVAEGFDPQTSGELVTKLLVGSAALLELQPDSAAELRARVTSPNGTTAAGVAALESHRVREAVIAAVRAATRRSKELGEA
ncbi:MAG: pyrroline-5-carboxylate reductase [Ilumatobacteraceae bacterium]